MTLLYDELVKIYCRSSQEATEDIENDAWDSYEDNADARTELATAIVKMAAPETVGDVMMLPHEGLRLAGLIFLIEKDASDAYDQVDGYVDVVIMEDVETAITPAQHGFDGLKLCEWIDQEFPREPER